MTTTQEREFAREVGHWLEGDCPVCFYGSAPRCRSRMHRRVLSAVSPQPDPELRAIPEPGSFRVLEVDGSRLGHHVRNAHLCWSLEHSICCTQVSLYPQHWRFLLVSPDDRPAGAAVVSRWRQKPPELEWLWIAPDYRPAGYEHLLTSLTRRFPSLESKKATRGGQ